MRFIVSRENLLRPLQLASGVVERRQTLPILSNVLLNVTPSSVAITATDLEIEIVVNAQIDGGQAGSFTIPAKKFIDICRALPEQALVDIAIDNERVIIKCGRSRFTLSTLPAGDFPNIEGIQNAVEFQLPQQAIKDLIDRTQFAMAQQDVRYYLNGLLLEVGEGKIRTVATDGHRLALWEDDSDFSPRQDELVQVIIPRKGVQELGRLLVGGNETSGITIGSNHMRIVTNEWTFTSKLIDGRFPDYQRVLPNNGDKIVICNRELLRQALVRASILSNEKYRSVRFELGTNNLKILAHNPEQEEAEEDMSVEYQGAALEIGFNANYILEALNAISTENIKLILTDANSCCLIQGDGVENGKYVVMPMRI